MRWRQSLAALVLVVLTVGSGQAMGFADASDGPTLRQNFRDSDFVAYGLIVNLHKEDDGRSTAEFVVDRAIKSHPKVDKQKVFKLPYSLQAEDSAQPRPFLVFFDLGGGRPDPFAGVPAQPATVDYLLGLVSFEDQDRIQQLRYCFHFLEHSDPVVAEDALLEFRKSTYPEIGRSARGLSPVKLRRWLQDPKIGSVRLGLYAFLLGNCGDEGDAALLRALSERLVDRMTTLPLHEILIGYTLLRPREGWAYTCQLLSDSGKDFPVRYAGLRTVRFFHDFRPDVIREEGILNALRLTLAQEDMADLGIDSLRGWRCWDLTDTILPLFDRASSSPRILRHAVVRYALQCPRKEAGALVARVRQTDPLFVQRAEEGLKWEASH